MAISPHLDEGGSVEVTSVRYTDPHVPARGGRAMPLEVGPVICLHLVRTAGAAHLRMHLT
jgi:hypothetical protein